MDRVCVTVDRYSSHIITGAGSEIYCAGRAIVGSEDESSLYKMPAATERHVTDERAGDVRGEGMSA